MPSLKDSERVAIVYVVGEIIAAIGILLLLFGMRWLRKAILRAAGIIPLHDEAATFANETADLRKQPQRHDGRLDWFAGLASFKAVLLEGVEVVFVVLAIGAGGEMLVPASVGAIAACALVAAAGFAVRRPLARAPPMARERSSLLSSRLSEIRSIR